MIISKTPFRIPLVGGGTDIDFYYKNRGGLLISATINKFIYTMLCKRIDKKILIQTTKSEFLDNINEVKYNKGIAYLLKYYRLNKSFQVSIFSNLPTNSGIGSSSSVFVGLAKSIYEQNFEDKNKLINEFKNNNISKDIKSAFPDATLVDIVEDKDK